MHIDRDQHSILFVERFDCSWLFLRERSCSTIFFATRVCWGDYRAEPSWKIPVDIDSTQIRWWTFVCAFVVVLADSHLLGQTSVFVVSIDVHIRKENNNSVLQQVLQFVVMCFYVEHGEEQTVRQLHRIWFSRMHVASYQNGILMIGDVSHRICLALPIHF